MEASAQRVDTTINSLVAATLLVLAGGVGRVSLVAGGGGGAVVECWLVVEAVLVPRLEGEDRRSAMMKFAAQQGS